MAHEAAAIAHVKARGDRMLMGSVERKLMAESGRVGGERPDLATRAREVEAKPVDCVDALAVAARWHKPWTHVENVHARDGSLTRFGRADYARGGLLRPKCGTPAAPRCASMVSRFERGAKSGELIPHTPLSPERPRDVARNRYVVPMVIAMRLSLQGSAYIKMPNLEL